MNGLGSGENGQFTFLDSVSLLGFFIGLMNLEENITQSDKQEMMEELNSKTDLLLREIHNHLQMQDDKIDKILKYMEAHNDSNRNI